VIVAVIDTGILPAHPDFEAGALLEGYDFITDTFVSRRPTAERVPGALDYGDWNDDASQCDVGGSSWHGTHVSGTVAEATNNSIGMAGVAPKATILPIRALGRCGGYTSDIADAIVWASGGTVAGMPANPNPAQVINMSLGGGGACSTSGATQLAINGAVSRGTTVVVAAGNSNANAANFSPASCANVINVGANGITGARASYSNYGALVDIAGPGGGGGVDGNPNGYVWQAMSLSDTGPTDGALSYGGMAGTSMAAPHVAGVVALVQSALVANDQDPLTPAAMEQLLKDSARAFPVSIPSGTPIGAGIVDPVAALQAVLGGGTDPGEPGDTTATPLTNKVAVTGVSGGEKLYSFEAVAGKTLTIMTYGGSGDVSLHVKRGAEPTTTDFDAKSTRGGNSETVRFTAPVAGTYYIKLSGTYAGLSVVARQ
jgi:serine protease